MSAPTVEVLTMNDMWWLFGLAVIGSIGVGVLGQSLRLKWKNGNQVHTAPSTTKAPLEPQSLCLQHESRLATVETIAKSLDRRLEGLETTCTTGFAEIKKTLTELQMKSDTVIKRRP